MNKLRMIRRPVLFLASPAVMAVALCVFFLSRPGADPVCAPSVLRGLADRATDQDAGIAKPAIARLRGAGPAGLAALMEAHAADIQRHRAMEVLTEDDQWPRVCSAIDAVAAQKDAWASGLYWYTDLEAAKRAATESGRPILSLRLLGTLDTEFSCANSRFFRTVLYANAEVSRALSSRFILHWKSVRPVPKVTIDFGDGRVVERTITGNSIHYVLDAEGRVIDGIPGLYGPKAFLRLIDEAAAHAADARSPKGVAALQSWHAAKGGQIISQCSADLQTVGADLDSRTLVSTPGADGRLHPTALVAARRAFGKSVVQSPLVAAIAPDLKALDTATPDTVWAKIAALHAEDSRLDSTGLAVMAAKHPGALTGSLLSKRAVDSAIAIMARNFERSIAEDTVRNEYNFHRRIHAWLAESRLSVRKGALDVDALNERVYADLFLTPGSDPWLGLLPANTYSALLDDGLCRAGK